MTTCGSGPRPTCIEDPPYKGYFAWHTTFDGRQIDANPASDGEIWFAADPWQVEQSNRLLDFFADQGINRYANQVDLDGTPRSSDHSSGLVAMNGVAALAATTPNRTDFV